MASEIIFEVQEDEADGGFTAQALGHDIFTEADSLEELRTYVRNAVLCHFGDGGPAAKDNSPSFRAGRSPRGVKVPHDVSGPRLANALRKLGYARSARMARTSASQRKLAANTTSQFQIMIR